MNLSDSGQYTEYFKKRSSNWLALMKFDSYFEQILFFHLITIATVLVTLMTGHILYFLMKLGVEKGFSGGVH